jgi:cyanate permease
VATLAQMAGLVVLPLIAQLAMLEGGWRLGWLAIGSTVLTVGFLPVFLLMVRRPEDLGLAPDRRAPVASHGAAAPPRTLQPEPAFSRRQALGTSGFWLLLLYTVLVYPVQAGVSLHQAPHLIERGIGATTAATIVSAFSLMSAAASLTCGLLPRRLPVRFPLAATGAILAAGIVAMLGIASTRDGYVAASLFGFGIGGVLTLLPLAWVDYFGRANYGAIRGLALSAQVLAQATGPLLSGALRDWTGSYERSLECFAALSLLSIAAALAARPPRRV